MKKTSTHEAGSFRLRARFVAVVAVCAGVALGLGHASVSARSSAEPAPYRDGVVLVGFEHGTPAAAAAATVAAVGATQARVIGEGVHVLHVPAGSVPAAVTALRARGNVRYAEPDYLQVESAVPNDPSFGLQWADLNTGQTVAGTAGTPGDDERTASAWNVTTGSKSIVVGEVDSGVDYTHPDLAGNIWSNPGGIGGCAAGTHGYNVLTSTCDPMDDETNYGGHGTHVAGIIGATGNNGVGVAGVNWQTTILPVKWLDSSGNGYTSDLITALGWIVQAKQAGVNVRVVNDSATFVGTAYSQALSDEIDTLGQNNILFVTAAGNTGDDNDDPTVGRYPCRYGRANEICVTASDQNDALPSWANYGPQTVDLAAPGNNIYSTLRVAAGSYGYISGGSMAAAQVSGAAALVLSQRPTLSTADLKTDLLSSVDPVPALSGLVRTGGRLDVCAALQGCAASPVNTGLPAVSGTAQEGQPLSTTQGTWSGSPTSYAYQWERCDATGASCGPIAGATASTYVASEADVGSTLRAVVTATNGGGSTGATSAQTGVVVPAGSYFGNATIGTGLDASTADWKRVVTFSLGQPASVSKLTLYLSRNASGQQVLRGVIYADNGGAPGALLATSNETTFSSSAGSGWYDLSFPSPVSLAGGKYWIGLIAGATSDVTALHYTSVASSSAVAPDTYSDGPSNPFGTPSRYDSEQLSIYATYSTGGDSTAPSVPSGLQAQAVSSSEIDLSWQPSTDNAGGSGLKGYEVYRNGGATPVAFVTAPGTSFKDTGLQASTTYSYAVSAVDNAGNESAKSASAQATTQAASGGGGSVALVQQGVGTGSGVSSFVVKPPAATHAGDALVVAVALHTATGVTVSSVRDSSGATWTKGPVGYLSGTSSRVELWYRLAAPSVSSVTVKLSKSAKATANVTEWSGVASSGAVDASAGRGNASSKTASTPTVTAGAGDLVIGAVNYPSSVTSTLATAGFSGLSDFTLSTAIHGRAAYVVAPSAAQYQATWSLSGTSGGSGGVILALKPAS